ncbi:unnamed protein product [Victoria cruziana]
MDIARRLERIEQEICQVEDEKLQREQMLGAFWEQMLGAFWEHLPALDPIIIRDHMTFLQNNSLSKTGRGHCSKKSKRSLFGSLRDRENEKVVTLSPCFKSHQATTFDCSDGPRLGQTPVMIYA